MADRQGFEPWIPFGGIHDFQSCAFDHSAIYPKTDTTYRNNLNFATNILTYLAKFNHQNAQIIVSVP